ncbi:hypothetical protein BC831DRAFT_451406 [Entophlyctis helioformis]|nr:hypothetical protein BC831DRAFT_451406 [Entophlyctis helioformis]
MRKQRLAHHVRLLLLLLLRLDLVHAVDGRPGQRDRRRAAQRGGIVVGLVVLEHLGLAHYVLELDCRNRRRRFGRRCCCCYCCC